MHKIRNYLTPQIRIDFFQGQDSFFACILARYFFNLVLDRGKLRFLLTDAMTHGFRANKLPSALRRWQVLVSCSRGKRAQWARYDIIYSRPPSRRAVDNSIKGLPKR